MLSKCCGIPLQILFVKHSVKSFTININMSKCRFSEIISPACGNRFGHNDLREGFGLNEVHIIMHDFTLLFAVEELTSNEEIDVAILDVW